MLRTTFALVALCLGLSLVAAQPPATAPAVTMDDIKKAWQERQDKVKTLKMSWKRVVVKPKGSLDFLIPRFDVPGVTAPQPPRDIQLIGEADLVLAENHRFRYDCRRETWWMASQSAKPFRHSAIFNGKDYLHSDSSVADPTKEQSAVQSASQAVVSLESLELYPIWWWACGAKGVTGQEPLAAYDTDGRTVLHKGVSCMLLEAKSRTTGSSERLTLTANGYLPVSFVSSRQGKPVTQLDIEYDTKNSTFAMPSKWRYVTRFVSGVTNESFEATVTACEVGVAVAESHFQLKPPPGTVVVDTRQRPESVALVLPDGNTSDAVDRRTVKTYEELVAIAQPRAVRWPWIVAAVSGVGAGVAGYALMSRRRRTV